MNTEEAKKENLVEVEVKYSLPRHSLKQLIGDAERVSIVSMHDKYYDTKALDLAQKDWWLRARNGNFELKIPAQKGTPTEVLSNQYFEFDDEHQILCKLGIAPVVESSLFTTLDYAQYIKIGSFVSTREKYFVDGFKITFDVADFGYSIAEIELKVPLEDKDTAEQKIIEFAKSKGFSREYVRGKLPEYFSRYNPGKFEFLKEKGIWK